MLLPRTSANVARVTANAAWYETARASCRSSSLQPSKREGFTVERFRVVALWVMLLCLCASTVCAHAIGSEYAMLRSVVVFLLGVGSIVGAIVLASDTYPEGGRLEIEEEEDALDRADAKRDAREDPPAGEAAPDGEGDSAIQRPHLTEEGVETANARRRACAAEPWLDALRAAGILNSIEEAVDGLLPAPPRPPSFLPGAGYDEKCGCPECVRDRTLIEERRPAWKVEADIADRSDAVANEEGLSPSNKIALRYVARHVELDPTTRESCEPTDLLRNLARVSIDTGIDPITLACAMVVRARAGGARFCDMVSAAASDVTIRRMRRAVGLDEWTGDVPAYAPTTG